MTSRTNKARLAIFGFLMVAAAVSSVLAARGRQAQQTGALLDGPATWVAFRASYRSVSSGVETTGTIWRSSNGSERHEVGLSPSGQSITILNIATRTMFVMLKSSPTEPEFESRQLILPQEGYLPTPKMSLDAQNVVSKTPVQVGSWLAWETESNVRGGGTKLRQFLAPELNFFPVRIVQGNWQREVLDVVFGEPDPSLMQLPTGAKIVRTGQARRLGRFTASEVPGIQTPGK